MSRNRHNNKLSDQSESEASLDSDLESYVGRLTDKREAKFAAKKLQQNQPIDNSDGPLEGLDGIIITNDSAITITDIALNGQQQTTQPATTAEEAERDIEQLEGYVNSELLRLGYSYKVSLSSKPNITERIETAHAFHQLITGYNSLRKGSTENEERMARYRSDYKFALEKIEKLKREHDEEARRITNQLEQAKMREEALMVQLSKGKQELHLLSLAVDDAKRQHQTAEIAKRRLESELETLRRTTSASLSRTERRLSSQERPLQLAANNSNNNSNNTNGVIRETQQEQRDQQDTTRLCSQVNKQVSKLVTDVAQLTEGVLNAFNVHEYNANLAGNITIGLTPRILDRDAIKDWDPRLITSKVAAEPVLKLRKALEHLENAIAASADAVAGHADRTNMQIEALRDLACVQKATSNSINAGIKNSHHHSQTDPEWIQRLSLEWEAEHGTDQKINSTPQSGVINVAEADNEFIDEDQNGSNNPLMRSTRTLCEWGEGISPTMIGSNVDPHN